MPVRADSSAVGEMLRISCEACGLDREVFHGSGMAGVGGTLCTCRRCKRLVLKKWSVHDDPAKWDNFRCPYCKHPIEPTIEDDKASDCPSCNGPLAIESIGIWD